MPFFEFFKKDPTIEALNIIKNIVEKKLTAQNKKERIHYRILHGQLLSQCNFLTPQPNDFAPSNRSTIIGILNNILILTSTLKEPPGITRTTTLVVLIIDMAEKFGFAFSTEAVKQSSFAAATQQNEHTLTTLNAYVVRNNLMSPDNSI